MRLIDADALRRRKELRFSLVEFVERKADKGSTSGDKSEFEQFGQAVPFDEEIPF